MTLVALKQYSIWVQCEPLVLRFAEKYGHGKHTANGFEAAPNSFEDSFETVFKPF